MFCTNCGTQLELEVKFCHQCGAAVKTPAAEIRQTERQEQVHNSRIEESTLEAAVSAKPKKPSVRKRIAVCIVIVVIAAIIIGTSNDNTKDGITNKTENLYISDGLELVDDLTWEREGNLITIKGKIKATEYRMGAPVDVYATFYDKDDAIIVTRGDTIASLQEGEKWAFEILAYCEECDYFIIDGIF